jgi:hypothetical protein
MRRRVSLSLRERVGMRGDYEPAVTIESQPYGKLATSPKCPLISEHVRREIDAGWAPT